MSSAIAETEAFISRLAERLRERFPAYTVSEYEPQDTELRPLTLWVTDDSIGVVEQYADQGDSTSVVLPVYVTIILDIPTTPDMMSAARERRLQLVATCQGVIREFSSRLPVIIKGEELVPRKEYIAAYVQLDVLLLDLESE